MGPGRFWLQPQLGRFPGIAVPAAGSALLMDVERILEMRRKAINGADALVACLLAEQWLHSKEARASPRSNRPDTAKHLSKTLIRQPFLG